MKYLIDKGRHLICLPYSIENLHKMAEDLDIGRHWFHNSKFPHYDVPKKRHEELMETCEVVSSKRILNIIKAGLVE